MEMIALLWTVALLTLPCAERGSWTSPEAPDGGDWALLLRREGLYR